MLGTALFTTWLSWKSTPWHAIICSCPGLPWVRHIHLSEWLQLLWSCLDLPGQELFEQLEWMQLLSIHWEVPWREFRELAGCLQSAWLHWNLSAKVCPQPLPWLQALQLCRPLQVGAPRLSRLTELLTFNLHTADRWATQLQSLIPASSVLKASVFRMVSKTGCVSSQ